MKRTAFVGLMAVLTTLLMVTGCKKESKPISEIIAKNWTAQKVEEGTSTVYTKGGQTNVRPGYSQFQLNLASPPSVTYKEFDGNTFTGQYEVTDSKLTLKSLTPQPTGTNGTIEFTINSASENELIITRTTASQKTGNSVNKYTLTNP
ncbi:hypothetical protein [Tellurirhabdus rosea]|uniref:hypothetical protein n=1 Tax=Tellurirhabdus rosea TaxID=2674997 RepID=UPI002258939E|nr:hypothetical protein [Tellurirhabdus rosea]